MSEEHTTPVALVDDHTLVRTGLVGLVNRLGGYSVVMEADDGSAFTKAMATAPPIELAIVDLNMPIMDGYATIGWMHREYPTIKCIALTFDGSESAVIRAIRSGARGFLLKNMKPEEFKLALDSVRDTGYYTNDLAHPSAIESTDQRTAFMRQQDKILDAISPRELEFIKLACSPEEPTYEEIGLRMNARFGTVDTWRKRLFDRFGIKSKTGLVIFAYRWGIVKVSGE